MRLFLAIASFVVAALAFLYGFIVAYRQSRRVSPNAIVPTLPWTVAAALFLEFGLVFLPYAIPWWVFPLAFVAGVIIFGRAIILASARRD